MFVRRKLGDDNLIATNDYLSFNVKHFDNSRKILCWKRERETKKKRTEKEWREERKSK